MNLLILWVNYQRITHPDLLLWIFFEVLIYFFLSSFSRCLRRWYDSWTCRFSMISFISLIMKCGRDSVFGILWCRCSSLWQVLRCRFHCQSTSVCPAVTGPSIGGFWGGCFCCLFSEWLFREICLDWTAVIFISIQILCSLLLSAILLRQSFSYIFHSGGR